MLLIGTYLKEKPNRIVGYMENIANFRNIEFRRHFRLSFEAFEYLLEQIGPLLKSKNENKQTDSRMNVTSEIIIDIMKNIKKDVFIKTCFLDLFPFVV